MENTQEILDQILKKVKGSRMKLEDGKIWHDISQLEANKMKNFNNGLKRAEEIIREVAKNNGVEGIIYYD